MFNQKSVISFQGYDKEITMINGNLIERFYLDSTKNNNIVCSKILYHGTSREDAQNNLMKYFQPAKRWYFCGNRLTFVEG